ncbi:GNAT family N-acetyltransferase [Corynebacterium glyciniphilum]|uniref:GNAT family N-acetyltransferase n=1 Tax=Corynebacterium glyciniphilum TaxID=1404244 RepID=UPI002651478F|nr:GNAT family N-acetyltransferase [Corynebacterium glyciniphilum]MDN5683559.1 GNAT family N-acetyltransferase [Corynebacterium glyciniphilum]MDN6706834.1 GNAT family N-acetyltransferase [Corynebacterium glyciniphilum]
MFWPELPERFPTGTGREMRRVAAQDAARVEAALPEPDRDETFRFFTCSPFPLAEFVADDTRRTYALWDGERPLACTTVYNGDRSAGTVMLGYTWVMPSARGNGGAVNTEMKEAMYTALRSAGVGEVWFRADVENHRSCRSMEKNGAQRMHIEAAPRVYPDRVSQSVFYRKRLSEV